MKITKKNSVLKFSATILMLTGLASSAPAGLINNLLRADGYGRVGINFVFDGVTNTVKTATNGVATTLRSGQYVKQPYALIGTPPAGVTACLDTFGSCAPNGLPPGTPLGNFYYVRSQGALFSISNVLTGGATADNPELEKRLPVAAADCVSANMQTEPVFTGANSGTMVVNGQATAGTALWLRCFEYPAEKGDHGDVPADDPSTPDVDEGIEFLKLWGSLRYDLSMAGPYDFNPSDCTTVKIPFSFVNKTNLYFVVDTLAKSLPLAIICPPGIEVFCTNSFSYPPVQYAGCGDITFTYNPPLPPGGVFAAGSFPIGVTPVTVTATDKFGNSTSCSFTVTVKDNTPPVVPPLPTLTGESSVTVPVPVNVVDNCGGPVKVTTPDPLTYNSQGTFTVHWTFDDGHGNTSTGNQTVIVKDVTPPVPPTLATVSNQCSVTLTAPVATDAVAGGINGATIDPLVYSTQGTFTVHWTFNDGNGNSSAATQTVIVRDTIAPVPNLATLPVVTGTCATPAILTPPTATDNCSGIVTGTTTNGLSITKLGTTVVTWTFDDGHGNKSTQTQTVNVTGLVFQGFYSPVGTANNTINNPVSRTAGASFPLKWDILCGTSAITGGTPPTVDIQKVSGTPGPVTRLTADFQNDWHINWPTPSASKNDTYKATVNLPDGSSAVLFVKFK